MVIYSVTSTNSEAIERVSSRDILAALNATMNNKAGDCYGLYTEHYNLAGNLYYSVVEQGLTSHQTPVSYTHLTLPTILRV